MIRNGARFLVLSCQMRLLYLITPDASLYIIYMSHLMTCGEAPNCSGTDLAIPTPAGVNCAKDWEEYI